MATNPIHVMTIDQLKQELAMNEDMVVMLNSKVPSIEIAEKYGRYPDSTKEVVVTINALKKELVERGEIVEGYEVFEYSTTKTIAVLFGVGIAAAVLLFLIGKYKSLKI